MSRLLLFGVGSALVVEYEETCHRLGLPSPIGVQNQEGEVYLSDRTHLHRHDAIDATLLSHPCICPLFTPSNRRVASGQASMLGFEFSRPLIDPTAVVASSTEIEVGSYINAGVIIGAAGRIGRHAVINRGVGIGHHLRMADFVSIGPGVIIAGQVEIGTGAMIGAGAVILPKVRIGAFSVVGAGSLVSRDVPDRTQVRGNPARAVP